MKKLASFLILLIFTSGGISFICQDTLRDMFKITGAALTEVEYISTFKHLFDAIVDAACPGKDLEAMMREIAIDEDRKQECKNCASALKSDVLKMSEIRNYTDLKDCAYDALRFSIHKSRFTCFDNMEQSNSTKANYFRYIYKIKSM